MREVWMRREAVRVGVAGAFKERGLECRKVWTLGCSAEKGGGVLQPREGGRGLGVPGVSGE